MNEEDVRHDPAREAARPFAALCFVLLATLALLMPLLGGNARAELAMGRRGGDTRFDPGLMRLSPLILPSSDHLRKAQSVKLQPKKWTTGGGDAALLPVTALQTRSAGRGHAVFLPVSHALDAKPVKTHPPRAPPALLFPV